MILSELRETWRLALPLAAAFAGNTLLSLVDTVFAGRLGSVALSAAGVGGALFFFGSVMAMGLVMGLDPLVAQAAGAGDPTGARRHLSEGLIIGTLAAVPAFGFIFGLATVALPLAGTDPETTAAVFDYLWGRAPTVLPFLWFTALRGYLQTMDRASAGLWAALVANLINIPVDGLMSMGDGALEAVGLPSIGLPAQGVYGLGLASTLVTFVQVIVVWVVFRRMPLVPGAIKARWSGAKAIMKIGAPIGLHFSAEVGIFGTVSVVAGGMGPVVGGAHQVALQLASFTFMLCLGISQATTVRVGRAVGAGQPRQMQVAGLVGMGSGSVVMVISAVALSVWPEVFARVMTDDPEVQAAAIPLLRIAGVFQIFDGLQSVSAGALRGASDTRVAFLLALVGYWVVGLPVALGLAKGLGWGAPGLWWGLTSGLMVAGVALAVRFVMLARRGLRGLPLVPPTANGPTLPPEPVDPIVHGNS